MKTGQFILVIIIALISGMVGASLISNKTGSGKAKETVYERVMRTHTLRCAYTTFQPLIIKDINTGKMSGIMYDITEEIGQQLNLKVEWTKEVGPAGMFEGFKSNQYDAICVGYSRNPARATQADFTTPIFYLPSSIYVRIDDNRFDKDISILNSPQYKFNIVDGEASIFTIKNQFPKAGVFSMMEGSISDASTRLLTVQTKKADAVILDDIAAGAYIKANPGKVKMLSPPVNVYTSGIIVPKNEYQLKAMLDATISSLNENSFIKKSILKYSDGKGFNLVADPFNAETIHD